MIQLIKSVVSNGKKWEPLRVAVTTVPVISTVLSAPARERASVSCVKPVPASAAAQHRATAATVAVTPGSRAAIVLATAILLAIGVPVRRVVAEERKPGRGPVRAQAKPRRVARKLVSCQRPLLEPPHVVGAAGVVVREVAAAARKAEPIRVTAKPNPKAAIPAPASQAAQPHVRLLFAVRAMGAAVLVLTRMLAAPAASV